MIHILGGGFGCLAWATLWADCHACIPGADDCDEVEERKIGRKEGL